MSDTIIDGTQFDLVNTLMYTSPKASPQGGKSVNILNKRTKTGLKIVTPLMLTWGASDFVDEKTGLGNGKFEMALQFPSDEYKTDDTDSFFKNMMAFQNKIKEDALLNSKEWFGKIHKSSEIIDELFTPMMKYPNIKGSREPDYSKQPSLKIKIPQWEGVWKCEIYDEEDNCLFPNPSNVNVTPLDYLKKGINVAVIIQFAGIWFINGKFSISWKLVQAVVQKPRAELTGKCYIKLKKTDKEKLKLSADTTSQNELSETQIQSVLVDDSDEEEEEDVVARQEDEVVTIQEPPIVSSVVEVVETKKKAVTKRRS